MGQTIGSQYLGPWYDIIGWLLFSLIFFYFAFFAEKMPPQQREKFPAFLRNKKMCMALGLLLAVISAGKFLRWW